MRVDVVDDAAGLSALRPEWEALWQRDPTADVFSTFDWFDNWWTHFGHGDRPAALVVNDGNEWQPVAGRDWKLHVLVVRGAQGEAVALLPLVRIQGGYKEWKGCILATPTNNHAPRAGMLALGSDMAVSAALSDAIVGDPQWDLLLLDGLSDRDARVVELTAEIERHGLVPTAHANWHHSYLAFQGSWEEQWRSRTHKFRLHQGQNERSLAKLGPIRLDRFTGSDAGTRGFEAFVAVDKTSWKAREGESIGKVPELLAYYSDLVRRFGAREGAQIWVLSVGDALAASYLCLHDGRSLFTLKTSFSEQIGSSSRLSPSHVLLAKLVEASWGKEAGGIDFVGKTPYVQRWANCERGFTHRLWRRPRLQVIGRRLRSLATELWPLSMARQGSQ